MGKSLIWGTKEGSLLRSVQGAGPRAVEAYIPLYEEVNHIPLVVHFPGAEPRRCRAITQPMDIMPTILDLSGSEDPGTMHGRSMADVLSGGQDEHLDFAISAPYLASEPCPVTVVKDHWTGILYGRKRTGETILDRAVDGIEKIQDAHGTPVDDLLFDVDRDPAQTNDVKHEHPEILEELRSDLLRRLEETGTAEDIINRWR